MRRSTLGIVAAVFALAGVALISPAAAQVTPDWINEIPVQVWTDKTLYGYGSDVTIQGTVANLKDMPITITIISPQGNVVGVQQIDVSDDKTFKTIVKATGSLWNEDGLYTIRVQYGAQEVNDKTEIEIVGAVAEVTECNANEMLVKSSTDSYCVVYDATNASIKGATVGTEQSSIRMVLDTQTDASILLVIPRSILDSKSSTGDSPFIVMADGQPIGAYESHSDANSRTLEIDLPDYTEELEVIGTYAVPEFGTIAAMILVVAIASIVAVSSKGRLALFNRY